MAMTVASAMAIFLPSYPILTLQDPGEGMKIFASHLMLGVRDISVLFVGMSPEPSIMLGTKFPVSVWTGWMK